MKQKNYYPLFVAFVVADLVWIAVTVVIFHNQGRF